MHKLVAVLLAVSLAAAGCARSGDDGSTGPVAAPTVTAPPATSAAPRGETVETTVDKVRFRATAGEADAGKRLSVAEGTATLPSAAVRVGATEVLDVRLDGGKSQPTTPVRVQFDLSDRPDLVARITDGVVPVVETVSESDPQDLDMFRADWDPATKTISADVTHLTGIGATLLDIGKSVRDGLVKGFEVLRGTTNSPCRECSELTLDGVHYTLTAVTPGAVAGCLVNDGGALAVDFENATGSFYAIGVAPDSAGGRWVNADALDMSDSAGSIISSVPNSRGVLVGRSGGRLTMNEGIEKFDVRLAPQQQGILAKSLMSGLGMLGLDLKRLENVPEAWDCIATAVNATHIDASFSPGDLYSMTTDVAQCAVTKADLDTTDSAKGHALNRLGAAVELFSLVQQLNDFTAGAIQQFAQQSIKDFRIRSTGPTSSAPPPPSSSAPAPAEPPETVVDRIELKTWAYDKVAENTYEADNRGRKSNVNIHVNSFAGDEEVRSGCRTSVSVTGPGVSLSKSSDGCYIGNPGLTFDAPSVGEYVVTATVSQAGHADITSRVTVRIVAG